MVFGLFRDKTRPPTQTYRLPDDFDPDLFCRNVPFLTSARMLFDRPFLTLPPYERASLHVLTALNRAQPADLLAAFDVLFYSALAERAHRGFEIFTKDGTPILPETIAQGFVIERIPADGSETIIYAADARARPASAEYHAALAFLRYRPANVPAEMPAFQLGNYTIKALHAGALPNSPYWRGRYAGVEYLLDAGRGRKEPVWSRVDDLANLSFVPLVQLDLRSIIVAGDQSRDPLARADRGVSYDFPEEWRR